MRTSLRRDEKGASAIEFALAAPAMLMFVIGIAQLGMLCMADAGLRSAVAEGARAASLYPTPEDDAPILARIDEAAWGMQDEHITGPTIVRYEDPDEPDYIEITMSYDAPLNFAFLELEPVTLTEVRRVYTQGALGGGSSSSTTSGGSTTSGSTGSTGGTSSGSTSASSTSAGGTSSTSASSTSTGGTSSTSSGNGSNGNNGSSGHDHGGSNGNGSSGNSNGNSGH